MPRHKTLKDYKKRAPKIPDYTCTDIDNVISKIERISETKTTISKTTQRLLIRKLERLRNSNELLRDSGKYWYERFVALFKKIYR